MEKDNDLQECRDRLNSCLRKMRNLEEGKGVKKWRQEIQRKDDQIEQLENDLVELEKILNDRIKDFEDVDALMEVIREKEDQECILNTELLEAGRRIDELSNALEQSVAIATRRERDLQREERNKQNAIQWVSFYEKYIILLHY